MRTRIDPFNPPPLPPSYKPRLNQKRQRVLDLFTQYELLPGEYIRAKAKVGSRVITSLNRAHCIEAIPYSSKHAKLDARNCPPLWSITERGATLSGKRPAVSNDHEAHKIGRTLTQFSFDTAPDEIGGLILRTQENILMRPKAEHATWEDLLTIPVGDKVIEPDSQLFGYSYNHRYFYLFFEYDNGTETRTPKTHKGKIKKNITKMIGLYNEALSAGLIHQTLGISNIFIAIVADSELHAQSILKVIERDVPETRWHNFGVTSLPWSIDFHLLDGTVQTFSRAKCGTNWEVLADEFKKVEGCLIKRTSRRFPPPTAWAVTEDWQLAGGKTLNILDILGAKHGRRTQIEDWQPDGANTLNILDILGATHERGRTEIETAD
jgi:hypothetical protein